MITRFLPETRFFRFKTFLLRWCGATVGENVRINSSAVIVGTGDLVVGDDVWIGAHSYISATGSAKIVIGECCDIAPQVSLITGTHLIDITGEHVAGVGLSKNITIGRGCWLGARSIILPGISLADHIVVGAGSVVNQSYEMPYLLLVGNGATVKKVYTKGSK